MCSVVFFVAFFVLMGSFNTGSVDDYRETKEDSVSTQDNNNSSVESAGHREQLLTTLRALFARPQPVASGSKVVNRGKFANVIERGRRVPSQIANATAHNSCQKRSLKLVSRTYHSSGQFQKAGNQAFVYSAYYDSRLAAGTKQTTFVQIVGVSVPNAHLYCHLWHKLQQGNKRELEIVEGIVEHGNRLSE